MLFYRALKPIKKGDPLLAWYSASVERELSQALLNRDFINAVLNDSFHNNETSTRKNGKHFELFI